jgi:hypothetical protein
LELFCAHHFRFQLVRLQRTSTDEDCTTNLHNQHQHHLLISLKSMSSRNWVLQFWFIC